MSTNNVTSVPKIFFYYVNYKILLKDDLKEENTRLLEKMKMVTRTLKNLLEELEPVHTAAAAAPDQVSTGHQRRVYDLGSSEDNSLLQVGGKTQGCLFF